MHGIFKQLSASKHLIKLTSQNSSYSKASLLAFTSSISKVDSPVNNKQDVESKIGRKIAQKKLIEMLDIKSIKALEIVTTHKNFCKTQGSLMANNYEICTLNKLSKDVILKYPYVLTENDFSQKINMLKMLSIPLVNCIPLIKLSLRRLNNICLKNTETKTRIYNLCRIFNIAPSESCEILATKPFLLALDLNSFESHLQLLIENGISKEDVRNDLWIFKYSEQYIRSRLQCVKVHRVETVKPWMIRCPEETLYKHIKRESDNRDILGENSVAEYLSERLKCSENMSKYIIRRQPALQTKSLLKMNEMIDFLYKHGFTPSQICRVPKVLLHSTKTAKSRIKQLAVLGNKPDSLYVLTKSQKQYMQHIESLIKAKTKSNSVDL